MRSLFVLSTLLLAGLGCWAEETRFQMTAEKAKAHRLPPVAFRFEYPKELVTKEFAFRGSYVWVEGAGLSIASYQGSESEETLGRVLREQLGSSFRAGEARRVKLAGVERLAMAGSVGLKSCAAILVPEKAGAEQGAVILLGLGAPREGLDALMKRPGVHTILESFQQP